MKINLEKIQKLEILYQDNPISFNAFQNMIDQVINMSTSGEKALKKLISYKTLVDLGVITVDKQVQQLNS